MAVNRAQTFVTNTGPTRFLRYLPPAGRLLNAGETISIPGILETMIQLAEHKIYLQEYLNDQAGGQIQISYEFSGLKPVVVDFINQDSIPLVPGHVVAATAGGIQRACASSSGTEAVGLSLDHIAVGAAGKIQTTGLFLLPDWSALLGQVHLPEQTTYFLSPLIPGILTATVPTTPGQRLQSLGLSLTGNVLSLAIQPSILL